MTIRVDASRLMGELRPIYRFFGADEPNYSTMKDGRKLLAELGRLGPAQVYFRTHNLLNTGDGTPAFKWGSTNAYTEDAEGHPIYDWAVVDRIVANYLEHNLRPYVEIGFMPKALSARPEPYQHEWRPGIAYNEIYTGWSFPPKDYAKWAELIYRWVMHCVERFGRAEVEQWYWEVWNEPNIGYWSGTPQEFLKLHDYAIDAVRRALPAARVGGPDTAGEGGEFMRRFLDHCLNGTNYATGKIGTPLDFISFHAKGQPQFVDGHVRMGIAAQLRTIDAGFARIAGLRELKDRPIVIGESDPDGCAACRGPQLGYRNGTMYSSYTAASFGRIYDLAEKYGVNLEGALTWAFEFEDQPYFAGFRALASNGIDLPVLNVFRMLGRMGGKRAAVQSTAAVSLHDMMKDGVRAAADVSALASVEARRVSMLVWHYHDDDIPGPDAAIDLTVAGLKIVAGRVRFLQYRIDDDHSNAYSAWKSMGSPADLSRAQYLALEQAGRLAQSGPPVEREAREGQVSLAVSLPRKAVSLLVIDW